MKKEMCFVYVYNVTEHERGWATRPDGYMCFPDGDVAHKWLKEQYADRNINNVPDCYDTYDNGRYEPVHESVHDVVNKEGRLWIRSLKEVIKPTKTRKITLEWILELEPEEDKLTDDELYTKYYGEAGEIFIK